MSEEVEFNGVRFRRYPNAKQRSDRVYFTPGIAAKQAGLGRLHEELWKAEHGAIPSGHHIHHADGNPLNNELDNLECVPAAEHLRHHHLGVSTPAKRAHLAEIRHLAAAWHSSPEGLRWHSAHAHTSMLAVEPEPHACEQCGAEYMTRPKSTVRFCSNACKSAARRASHTDTVDRDCVVCGTAYKLNRYSKGTTCSRKCRWGLRRMAQADQTS